jgi:hypothetical protein
LKEITNDTEFEGGLQYFFGFPAEANFLAAPKHVASKVP